MPVKLEQLIGNSNENPTHQLKNHFKLSGVKRDLFTDFVILMIFTLDNLVSEFLFYAGLRRTVGPNQLFGDNDIQLLPSKIKIKVFSILNIMFLITKIRRYHFFVEKIQNLLLTIFLSLKHNIV